MRCSRQCKHILAPVRAGLGARLPPIAHHLEAENELPQWWRPMLVAQLRVLGGRIGSGRQAPAMGMGLQRSTRGLGWDEGQRDAVRTCSLRCYVRLAGWICRG